ncbi:MAG: hypothetical protein WBD07_10740 [Vicinamibacterales bacterium]
MEYTGRERFWLTVLAACGFLGINGVFLYSVLRQPDVMAATMANPVATAFVVEALVLTGVLAYLLARWKVSRVHWAWFVVLSLIGSIAFALPAVLLVTWRHDRPENRGAQEPSRMA